MQKSLQKNTFFTEVPSSDDKKFWIRLKIIFYQCLNNLFKIFKFRDSRANRPVYPASLFIINILISNHNSGGTLQQSVKSCLDSLDIFMKQSRPIVASMIVAEKRHIDTDIVCAVANILGKFYSVVFFTDSFKIYNNTPQMMILNR